MDVLFWQNIPSPHQAPALRVLAESWVGQVRAVWSSPISPDRVALGWKCPDFGKVEGTVLGEAFHDDVRRLIAGNREAIHVFSGLEAYDSVSYAFRLAVLAGATNLALMAEPGVRMGWRGALRPLRAWVLARRYVPRVKAVLAMGQDGVAFYRRAGFGTGAVYPFMYQSDAPRVAASTAVHDPVRLVYVGKFIARKGVDVMIRALGRCRDARWRPHVAGEGPERPSMQALAEAEGIADRIEWLGVQPIERIPGILSDHDVCLVPSRFEGWGVVTNEALQAGLAVVCSDRVTSRELVYASGAGRSFRSGSARSMAACLSSLLRDPQCLSDMKRRAGVFRSRITGETVGRYLRSVLTHAFSGNATEGRPAAPWLNQPDRNGQVVE